MRTILGALVALAAALLPAGLSAQQRALQPVTAFEGIADPQTRSAAIFAEMGKVLTHPRCVNCHPAGDRPLQRESGAFHEPMVVRGPDGLGAPGLRCNGCHGDANFEPARVPGHPEWHLAPREMAWQGLSVAEICAQIKDPARNGGKTLAQLVQHMGEDSLVGWGWAPPAGREPAPGTQRAFGALAAAWVQTGAACPAR